MKIAEVYLNQKNYRLDKAYDYLVDEGVHPGQRVKVPFGKGNSRSLEGFITAVKDEPAYEGELKEIEYLVDEEPILDEKQIQLCFFIKKHAFCLFYDALSNFTTGVKTRKGVNGKTVAYKIKNIDLYSLVEEKKVRGTKQRAVIEELKKGDLEINELKKRIPGLTNTTLNRLVELEIIQKKEIKPEALLPFKQVKIDWDKDKKTENKGEDKAQGRYIKTRDFHNIYNLIKESLEDSASAQAVAIFPDNFTAKRFSEFLEDKYAIEDSFYSGRFEQRDKHLFYRHVKDGDIRIVVGSNTALFLPYNNLKSVILVNAGDESYAQSLTSNFDTIDTAEKLAELWEADFTAVDIMDSVLAEQKIESGQWREIEPAEEAFSQKLRIENIKHLYNKSINHAVSDILYKSILKNLKEGKKTVLLFNRKGYYNLHYCLECGESLVCPECGSNLKSVKGGKEVTCRSCGYSGKFPEKCPNCGSRHIEESRFGIEKVAEQLAEIFPEADVELYFHGHIPKFEKADIIIGTKSLMYLPAFKNTATVAAVLVDLDLDYPDYRSAETAFRLYNDFFMRYPESEHIVQTRGKNLSFISALEGDSKSFFDELKLYRKSVKLPPYADLYTFTLSGESFKITVHESNVLHDRIKTKIKHKGRKIVLLDPYKIRGQNGKMQQRFILKADKDSGFEQILEQIYEDGEIEALQSKVSIMVNPANFS